MPSAIGKPRYLFVPTLVLLAFLVPSAFAQQPPAQPPAPTPPDSQSEKPKDGKDDQDKKTPAPAQATTDDVGKSKLEQETGTINDRIFDVVPNYGTVETAKAFRLSRPARNFGSRRPAFLIGALLPSTRG